MSKRGQKVVDILEEYGLEWLGPELERRWTHDDEEVRMSVRELARFFNAKVVEAVLDDETGGVSPTRYPSDRIAHLLAARNSESKRYDDVKQADVNEIVAWLESHDIDVDTLAEDLVTHPVIHAYLRNIRGIEPIEAHRKSTTPTEIKRSVLSQYEGFKSRGQITVEGMNESLENAGLLPESPRSVRIEVTVTCLSCGNTHSYESYVENHGCTVCGSHAGGTEEIRDRPAETD